MQSKDNAETLSPRRIRREERETLTECVSGL
jgi:hypothetical protein